MTDFITLHKVSELTGKTYKTIRKWCDILNINVFYVKVPGVSGGGNASISIKDYEAIHLHKKNKIKCRLEFVEDFYREMSEEMQEQGLTYADISIITGIDTSTLSAYMNGSKLPNLDTISKMADAINMKPVLCLVEN